MKLAKRIFTVLAAIAVATVIAVLLTALMLAVTDRGIAVGRYIESKKGTPIVVVGDRPIRMNDLSEDGELFDRLEEGDLILVTHTAVAEIYPAITGVYSCLRLCGGSIEDMSETALAELDELGWIDHTPKPERDPFAESAKVDHAAQYIRTNGYHEDVEYPYAVIITSVAQLDRYYEQNKHQCDLERREKVNSDNTIGFLDAVDKYDEEFFKDKKLVMIILEEGSGSVRHKVTRVGNEAGRLYVSIERTSPEDCTDDMAEWHIILELDRDVNIKNADMVEVK